MENRKWLSLKMSSDEQLIQETNKLVHQERELLTDILHHLREINRRRLFSKLKFPSLYEYCTKSLGYSEDQAYRRIQAMRLLSEIPEIETKINDGSLSLSHLGVAQSLFKREEKTNGSFTKEEKLELLKKLENTSKREAERIAIEVSPETSVLPDKIKQISNDQIEVRFSADQELLQKIAKLKGLLAHKNPHMTLGGLFAELCNLGIKTWDKSEASAPARKRAREIWRRDQGCCKNCGSRFALEIDHIVPKALGGGDAIENLRLLCRSCNQRAAIECLGQQKMAEFLP